MNYPTLTLNQGKISLLVNGEPYLVLGGELCNSSASSLTYMQENVWPYIRHLNLNTLLLPICWDLIESEEGIFDFSIADGLIRQAEQENCKLIYLWFGLWKNGISTYVPSWMKGDKKTYFTMQDRHGKPINSISPLCQAAVEKDAAAFTALMTHLREQDKNRTVIMIQVENEMGLLGDCRDFSPAAEQDYIKQIPPELASLYQAHGTWQQAFGEEAPELFMTYHYSKATEYIASRGRSIYPIPMYVNAWLEQYPWTPGTYPSGGPIARHMDIWKGIASSIDFMAPDIYLPDFESVCDEYTVGGNVLFIPEARPSLDSASNVFSAFGKFGALGFSPFAIEKVGKDCPPPDKGLLEQLNIMAEAFRHYRAGEYLSQSYKILSGMTALLEKYRSTPHMRGFTCCNQPGTLVSFESYDFRIEYPLREKDTPKGGGLIIALEQDEYLFCGLNFRAVPLAKNNDSGYVEIVSITEGHYENSLWIPQRHLNGDEFSIQLSDRPTVLRCQLKRNRPFLIDL